MDLLPSELGINAAKLPALRLQYSAPFCCSSPVPFMLRRLWPVDC
jgi:hypothetical protein